MVDPITALLQPANLAELTGVLESAAAERTPIVVDGRGAPGVPAGPAFAPRPGAYVGPPGKLLSLASMPLSIEHCAGDLVATIPAGVSLDEANAVLGRNGQWLALDPPLGGSASIGAIVATNASGPRRHRHGTPRDLIIGVEMALADGRIARAGGKVVKNVAGYDLARLMCGSLGSLAIITSATFKLTPIAAASRTVVVNVPDTGALLATLEALAAAPMTPSAVELETPPHRLLVRFETTPKAAQQQSEATAALALRTGGTASIVSGDDERACWDAYIARTWSSGFIRLRVSLLPSHLGDLLSGIERLPRRYSMGGRAALGVLYLAVPGSPEEVNDSIDIVREVVRRNSGHLSCEQVRPGVSAAEAMSSPDDALPLMQALKRRFDPLNILNPGQGPAGL